MVSMAALQAASSSSNSRFSCSGPSEPSLSLQAARGLLAVLQLLAHKDLVHAAGWPMASHRYLPLQGWGRLWRADSSA